LCEAIVLAAVLVAGSAERQEVLACIQASSRGQELRDQGDLLGARVQLRSCAGPCPKAIRSDCTRWLADVEQAIPTVVPVVREGSADVLDAEVAIDGVAIVTDGRPLEINPGRHRFTATRQGASQETVIVVAAAERNRLVVLPWQVEPPASVVVAPRQVETSPPSPRPLPPVAPPAVARAPPTVSRTDHPLYGPLSLAGVGIAGIVVFAAVGASGHSDLIGLEASPCGEARTCAPGTTDGVRTKYLVADVGLAVGVAAALGAAGWYLFGGESPRLSIAADGRSVAAACYVTF
jgi:hypothetical protein